MRRPPTIWLVTLVTLLFSALSPMEIERVREVFADGRSREFLRVDLDGMIPRQDVTAPEAESEPIADQSLGYSRRLVQVLESPGFSVPASVVGGTNWLPQGCQPALLRSAVSIPLAAPVFRRCATETRGPPLRPRLLFPASLRAPPSA